MDKIIKGVTACEVSECDSLQHELNERSNGTWICDSHLNEEKAGFEDMARSAMTDLGIDDEFEQDNLLDDYVYQY